MEELVLNPRSLQSHPQYRALSRAERGLLRDLLDTVWLSEGSDSCGFDLTGLAERLGASVEELAALIERLRRGGKGALAKREVDERGRVRLRFTPLKAACAAAARADQAERPEQASEGEAANVLEAMFDVSLLYLAPGSRGVERFDGWLPTRGFDSRGQAVVVDAALREATGLAGRADAEARLEAIFRWLVDNPERRPGAGRMTSFIRRWLEREQASGRPSRLSTADAVEAQLEAMLAGGACREAV